MKLPILSYSFTENKKGASKDLKIFEEDDWLHNSEVKYFIAEKNGRWHLTMLYIFIHNPLKLLCKYIDEYESYKKAEIYAQFFQRGIRKDARGTLKTNENAYDICFN